MLEDYTLLYKLRKYGGIPKLFGRDGKDFWVAVVVAIFYLLSLYKGVLNPKWVGNTSFFLKLFIFIIGSLLVLLGLLHNYQSKFNEENQFNLWLIKKDVMDELDFLIEFPQYVIVFGAIILIIYTVILFITLIPRDMMSLIFAIPLFFVSYGISGFIYAMKTVQYYKKAHNKWLKNH